MRASSPDAGEHHATRTLLLRKSILRDVRSESQPSRLRREQQLLKASAARNQAIRDRLARASECIPKGTARRPLSVVTDNPPNSASGPSPPPSTHSVRSSPVWPSSPPKDPRDSEMLQHINAPMGTYPTAHGVTTTRFTRSSRRTVKSFAKQHAAEAALEKAEVALAQAKARAQAVKLNADRRKRELSFGSVGDQDGYAGVTNAAQGLGTQQQVSQGPISVPSYYNLPPVNGADVNRDTRVDYPTDTRVDYPTDTRVDYPTDTRVDYPTELLESMTVEHTHRAAEAEDSVTLAPQRRATSPVSPTVNSQLSPVHVNKQTERTYHSPEPRLASWEDSPTRPSTQPSPPHAAPATTTNSPQPEALRVLEVSTCESPTFPASPTVQHTSPPAHSGNWNVSSHVASPPYHQQQSAVQQFVVEPFSASPSPSPTMRPSTVSDVEGSPIEDIVDDVAEETPPRPASQIASSTSSRATTKPRPTSSTMPNDKILLPLAEEVFDLLSAGDDILHYDDLVAAHDGDDQIFKNLKVDDENEFELDDWRQFIRRIVSALSDIGVDATRAMLEKLSQNKDKASSEREKRRSAPVESPTPARFTSESRDQSISVSPVNVASNVVNVARTRQPAQPRRANNPMDPDLSNSSDETSESSPSTSRVGLQSGGFVQTVVPTDQTRQLNYN